MLTDHLRYQFGDLERCELRPGNVHSADGWKDVLEPVAKRYRGKVSRLYFRTDAGFANPDVYEYLEAERIKYAIRLAEVAISRQLFADILRLIAELRPPPDPSPA